MNSPGESTNKQRLRIVIRGAVQGVGFRPFIYRLAREMGLAGWVRNDSRGVHIEVEGPGAILQKFFLRIEPEKPPRASIQSMESSMLDQRGFRDFVIVESSDAAEKTTVILPDIALCEACRRELFDPGDRRYRYPFITCTQCGPRFSIIESLPYDRPKTTMRHFTMCATCQAEYDDPLDRRFHAQPNACPECGPHMSLIDGNGRETAARYDALRDAAAAIRDGEIVAVKGLGGFHLMTDARNNAAVERLRDRKRREEKPFALMYPSPEMIEADCRVSPLERRALESPEAPIVLLDRILPWNDPAGGIAPAVSPSNPRLGIMLPYTPLHHLLMAECGFPVVATSGNRSDEPIAIDTAQALERLNGIADRFLVHDRPIARHVDDSIVSLVGGRAQMIRRARGFAPLPVVLEHPLPSLTAAGGHLKNSVAISVGSQVFVGQHIGDLETIEASEAFEGAIRDMERLYDVVPDMVVCDLHPEYESTRWAEKSGRQVHRVQHHYAHIMSCMAENGLHGNALGIAWDGTGYGLDGTVWGGEFLKIMESGFERSGYFRTFRLPGGEQAVREPRRSALGALYECFGDALFAMRELAPVRACSDNELRNIRIMLRRTIQSPVTSSAGRLFDAVSSILDIRQRTKFEGQAAMALEFAAAGAGGNDRYPVIVTAVPGDGGGPRWRFDWEPMLRGIVADAGNGLPAGVISATFHNTLAEVIVEFAGRIGESRVVLAGGCFQNRYLSERAIARLREEGFTPYWHQRIPPNDGGIALGQIAAVARVVKRNAGN